jgi:hypothetical protein
MRAARLDERVEVNIGTPFRVERICLDGRSAASGCRRREGAFVVVPEVDFASYSGRTRRLPGGDRFTA